MCIYIHDYWYVFNIYIDMIYIYICNIGKWLADHGCFDGDLSNICTGDGDVHLTAKTWIWPAKMWIQSLAKFRFNQNDIGFDIRTFKEKRHCKMFQNLCSKNGGIPSQQTSIPSSSRSCATSNAKNILKRKENMGVTDNICKTSHEHFPRLP